MLGARGVELAHTKILRWVQCYVPEFSKRWDRFRRRAGASRRVDKTYISVRGRWHYLCRAVDQFGKTIDFLLRRDRGVAAAQAFFRRALDSNGDRFPRTVTLDEHVPSRRALWLLRRERVKWRHVKVRRSQYLNNIVGQDHRGINARWRATKGFKSFASATTTLAGFELAHRIRKRQFSFGRGRRPGGWSRKDEWGQKR